MPTIDEKRVYTDNTGTETVFVATSVGLVSVSVSDDLVGGFGVAHRCSARDVAVERGTADSTVAVAADEGVFAATAAEANPESPESATFEETGFGPASAVGFDGSTLLAADEDGRVARFEADEDAAGDGGDVGDGEWETVGTAGAVRALDGDLVAAADGVHRVTDDGLAPAGLDDAQDVVVGADAAVAPLAATGAGLFKLGNGWMEELTGAFDAVAASADGRRHAVSEGDLFARGDDGEWAVAPLPVEEDVAAVAHGVAATYAVTDAGTFLVKADRSEEAERPELSWRHQVLGLRDVGGVAVR
ncbi:HVO_0234 family beta-propeller protein [Halopelagius fulvigenes]|uniref:HVO-0234-like beta-propeller domain-containing protein n=1 Tax=Halopelagius fulvigenes TaxID=1198324 RepID=A0ABD5U702_9EURY